MDRGNDEVQLVIPAGWRQEGHPATKTLHQFPFIYLMSDPITYDKQNDGEPGQLQDGVPVTVRVMGLMFCNEASGGMGEYFLCTRLHKICNLERRN